MNGPRTTREALVAEILGDLDALLARVEALPKELNSTSSVLQAAGEKYRAAISEFTEMTKSELTQHIDSETARANRLLMKSAEIQKEELRKAVESAFKSLAPNHMEIVGYAIRNAAKEFQQPMRHRIFECAIAALLSSFLASVLVVVFLRYF